MVDEGVGVGVPVGVAVAEGVGVALCEMDELAAGVMLADAPFVRLGVGVAETEVVTVAVGEAVGLGVGVAVWLLDGVAVMVCVGTTQMALEPKPVEALTPPSAHTVHAAWPGAAQEPAPHNAHATGPPVEAQLPSAAPRASVSDGPA